jgi:hypothetical protein
MTGDVTMGNQATEFLMWIGAGVLIVAFLALFITLLGLAVGESPREWWRGFWR